LRARWLHAEAQQCLLPQAGCAPTKT
jgi:hypothetical protein